MKIIFITSIVCVLIFGQVEPSLIGLGLPDVLGKVVPGVLGLRKPNPEAVGNTTHECLVKEFQPLADVAVPVVALISVLALILSGCSVPNGFVAAVSAKTQNTLNDYVLYEASNCSEIVRDVITEDIKTPYWNVLLQEACVLNIFNAAHARLAEGVVNAVNNSCTDIEGIAKCRNPNFHGTLAGLLKLLYDRVGLVAATFTSLNVQYIFAGLGACLDILGITLPLPAL